MAVFTLGDAVLFRCVRAAKLTLDAVGLKKIGEFVTEEFTSAVGTKKFRFAKKLIFDEFIKDFKLSESFLFVVHQVYPGKACEIVSK